MMQSALQFPVSRVTEPAPAIYMGRALLCLMMAAIFLSSYHLWRVGPINLTLSDILFSFTFLIFLLSQRLTAMPFGAMTPLWVGSLVIMLMLLFISTLANGDPLRWGIVAAQYGFSFLVLPMILLGQTESVLNRLMLALIAGVVVLEAVGIGGYYLLGGYTEATAMFGPDFITGAGRLGSFVGDANWNGAIIAMTVQFVIYAVRTGVLGPALGMICAAVLLWGLTLCASFTAFAATTLGGMISILVGRPLQSVKVFLTITVVGLGLYFTNYQPPEIFTRRVATALENRSLEEAGTYLDRVDLIAEAWKKTSETTFVGLGADKYRVFSAHHQPVHNMYLLLWTEGGLLAMVGWIGMMFILLSVPFAIFRHDGLKAALSLSVVLVFLINTVASPHMYHRLWVVPLLIALGLAMHARTRTYYPHVTETDPESPAPNS